MVLRNVYRFLLIFTGLSGSIAFAATDQNPQAAAAKVSGEKIYMENCAICHGDSGNADTRAAGSLRPPPRNFTTLTAAMELSRQRMINSVTNGRPGTAMMPHKDRLSPREIEAVVDFIRGNFMQSPEPARKQELAKHSAGQKIYAKNCSVCHGDNGQTAFWAKSGLNPQPRNFTTAKARKELTRERMIHSVTNGRPGTAMMPHKKRLTSKQIEQVVDYIRTAFMTGPTSDETAQSSPSTAKQSQPSSASKPQVMQGHPAMPGFTPPSGATAGARSNPHQGPHTGGMPGMTGGMPGPSPGPLAKVDMSVPMPKGLHGDVAKGKAFYMDNCFTCHGVKGDGNGPRADFNTPRPRNFTSDESRRILNRERLFHSITNGRVGTVMPAWGKVLNDQQIANVAEFVFTTFVHPKGAKAEAKGTSTASVEKKKPTNVSKY
jgi:mono/diheme cytochrome c family protein